MRIIMIVCAATDYGTVEKYVMLHNIFISDLINDFSYNDVIYL